jgi:hypothetical protein
VNAFAERSPDPYAKQRDEYSSFFACWWASNWPKIQKERSHRKDDLVRGLPIRPRKPKATTSKCNAGCHRKVAFLFMRLRVLQRRHCRSLLALLTSKHEFGFHLQTDLTSHGLKIRTASHILVISQEIAANVQQARVACCLNY